MSTRLCIGGCGAEVSGRRKRCPDCRHSLRKRLDKRRYHQSRGQDVADYDHLPTGPAVDYTVESAKPPTPDDPVRPWRQPPQLDRATKIRLDHAAQLAADDELPDQISWSDLIARPPDTRIYFPPAPGSPAAASNPFRSPEPQGELINPAAIGQAYRPRPAVNTGANGYLFDRWGRATPR
jgi:hypothetical protein